MISDLHILFVLVCLLLLWLILWSKAAQWGNDLFQFTSKPSLTEAKSETWRWELKQRPLKVLLSGFLTIACPVTFLIQPWTTCLGMHWSPQISLYSSFMKASYRHDVHQSDKAILSRYVKLKPWLSTILCDACAHTHMCKRTHVHWKNAD